MAATKTSNSRESSTTRPPVPLTTFFTPPATCLDVVTYDGTSFWQNGLAQTGDAGCYPSGFSKIYNSWFTPGICPESWTSVGTDPSHPSTVSDAMCCPSYVPPSRFPVWAQSLNLHVPIGHTSCIQPMAVP